MTAQELKDKAAWIMVKLMMEEGVPFIELMQDIGEKCGEILNGQLEGRDEVKQKREG